MLSGISLPHILLLLLIVVLLFGTSKLKNLGKDLGSAIKGFKESMKGEDDAPAAPPAQLNQQQTPPAQTTRQPSQHESGQGQ